MMIEVVEKVTRTYEINCASIAEAKQRALQWHSVINRRKWKKTKSTDVVVINDSRAPLKTPL